MAGRIIGWLLTALALIAAGGDLVCSFERGRAALSTLGDAWSTLSPHSLELAKTGISALHPGLWSPGADWLLRQPVAAVALILGGVFLALFRPRDKRRPRPTFGGRIG